MPMIARTANTSSAAWHWIKRVEILLAYRSPPAHIQKSLKLNHNSRDRQPDPASVGFAALVVRQLTRPRADPIGHYLYIIAKMPYITFTQESQQLESRSALAVCRQWACGTRTGKIGEYSRTDRPVGVTRWFVCRTGSHQPQTRLIRKVGRAGHTRYFWWTLPAKAEGDS